MANLIKRKGHAGAAKAYLTRTQAVRKLQISLPDFRKLCIWKGIYPREPRDKKKVIGKAKPSTTFYHTKDIQYLAHEPLLQKFREQKVLEKKIARALGRGEVGDAARFERNAARPEKTGRPRYTLDHVVRERYPTFIDALRDLDDCLSMLFLFASLPATTQVPAKMIARCEHLCMEFQHYLIVSHSLCKSFLSIKGIYYQANIQGEEVLWVVPYKFKQQILGDIDFRIMATFVEFYITLLSFVNHRLYSTLNLKYPPKFDQGKDEQAGELGAFTLEGTALSVTVGEQLKAVTNVAKEQAPDPTVQAEVNKLVKQLKENEPEEMTSAVEEGIGPEGEEPEMSIDAIDKFEPAVSGGDILPQPSYNSSEPEKLFSECTIFLSRETPRQSLEFLLRAFGCKRIGWDTVLGEGAFTTDASDSSITHQIVDRPQVQATVDPEGDGEDNQTAQRVSSNKRVPGRIYVQPQWVWDSINEEKLQSPELYAPGAQLPPHLSPFVKSAPGQYDPTLPLEEQETEAEALEAALAANDEEDKDQEYEEIDMNVGGDGFSVAEAENDEDEEVEVEAEEEEEDQYENDEAVTSETAQRQRELEAEITGKAPPMETKAPKSTNKTKEQARKELQRKAREEADAVQRAKGMLSKKKRKLFEQMQFSNSKKHAEDIKLRAKRRKIEAEKKKKKCEA